MNDSGDNGCDTMRAALRELFQDAGYVREEMLQWVDEVERRSASERDIVARLKAENDRLKQDVRKLRIAQAGVMSSRLKDALRE